MKAQKAKICGECGREFSIIKEEAAFYQRKKLPEPEKCFICRRKRRLSLRNPRELFERKCDKCGVELLSSYSASSKYQVYCEKCYLASR